MTPDTIAAQLALFVAPSQVTELRALHVGQKGRTFAGFFDGTQLREMARHALALSRQAAGVYFVPNPINPSLLDRCPNKTINVVRRGSVIAPELTRDADIIERRYLFVDVDVRRFWFEHRSKSRFNVDAAYASTIDPDAATQFRAAVEGQHTPTNAQELAFSLETIRKIIIPKMIEAGFKPPLIALSGNGFHILFRLSSPLPNFGVIDTRRDPLAKRLAMMAQQFVLPAHTIDVSTYTPARMLKVPWTIARKGESFSHRPHRMARFIEVPDGWAAHNTESATGDDIDREYVPEFLEEDDVPAGGTGGRVRSDRRHAA